MSPPHPLLPRRPVPALSVPLVSGGHFELLSETPPNFVLVVFYRGIHCPICRKQLQQLEGSLSEFQRLGTSVIAISSDDRERAARSASEWGLSKLRVGYDFAPPEGRRWGLFASQGRPGSQDPALFVEPGLFLITAARTLYFSSVQTMPFARPHVSDILSAVGFVLEKNYPARGEADVDTLSSALN